MIRKEILDALQCHGHEEIIFDEKTSTYRIPGWRLFFMTTRNIFELYDACEKIVGPGGAAAILRMYGLHAGGNIASSFVKLPATKEEVVELDFTFVHHQLGWYNTHQFEFDGEKGKIVIDYSCFAEPILAQKVLC